MAGHQFALRRISTALILVGPVTTLIISPNSSLDPISVVKLVSISIFGFGIFSLVVLYLRQNLLELPRAILIGVITFLFALLSSFLFSGSPLNQQFWGSFGRSNGFLCYLALTFILVASALVGTVAFYHMLILALIGTSIPMTIYCLMQMIGRDPIGWSELDTFGTLGNINFLSAFFGMTTVALLAQMLRDDLHLVKRTVMGLFILLKLYIVYSTGSIQGLMMFLGALSILGIIVLRYRGVGRLAQNFYFGSLTTFAIFTLFGLADKGPLSRFLYQPSVTFRGDYMHAGIEMTLRKPFLGVGLDSYGDYYREVRGYISTTRTGPDRVANTAHNLFLDLSASGGFPLLAGYALLFFYVGKKSFLILRDSKHLDVTFMTLFVVWVAYHIQALVSINQIGVGIWGWLFTGALIGYPRMQSKDISAPKKSISPPTVKQKSQKSKTALPIKVSLVWWIGAAIGLLISYPPFQADANYKKASMSRNLDAMFQASSSFAASAWHMNLTLDAALKSNAAPQAKLIAVQLVDSYPRDFFGWRILSALISSSVDERTRAYSVARSLDPFNVELQKP